MAPYPTQLTIGAGSRRIPRTGRILDLSGDGLSRVRKVHGDKYDFEIVHPALNATDLAAAQAFFDARAADNAAFEFYWLDGVPYMVNFDEPPWAEEPLGAGPTTLRVTMRAPE